MALLYGRHHFSDNGVTWKTSFMSSRRNYLTFYNLSLIDLISVMYHIDVADTLRVGNILLLEDMNTLERMTNDHINKLLSDEEE